MGTKTTHPPIDTTGTVRQILTGFTQDNLGYTDYLRSDPASNEAVVRLKIAEPLLEALGYDLQADLAPEHRVKDGAIDILVRANAVPVMLWELKRTQETDLARHEDQLTRYTLFQGVAHAVLCNGREVRVYQRVGEELCFAYTFPLTAFAPGALVPPTDDEQLALSAFFDAFRKQAFLKAEGLKREIIATTVHPLALSPDNPQNEHVLVDDLKREIRRLHRFVLLRFRSHQTLHREFMEEKEQREELAAQARERLWEWMQNFEKRARTPIDRESLETYLETFADHWMGVEEHEFVADVLDRSGVANHVKGANHANFRTRAADFYRAFTDYARWHTRRLIELRPIRLLIEDFDRWRDEIGVMAEDYAAEFCLQTVYIFITRLLLIRICEDKGLITQKISDGGYKDYVDFGERFFDNIADAHATLLDLAYKDTRYIYGHFFSRGIFDWYDWEEEAIVRLFWVLNRFDFASTSADLIGRIYEQYVDELERKRKGQFYTPPQVVNYILDQVGYEGSEIVGRRLLDPACGSGRFLVEAARRLIPELKNQPGLSPKEIINERLRNSLFGLDVNRFACFLAEVNLLVQVLELVQESETDSTRRNKAAFTIARFHIYPTNTLLPSRERDGSAALVGPGNGLVYESEAAELIKGRGYNPALGLDFRAGFDWVVGNPPYARADSPGVSALRGRIESSDRYRTLYKKWDLYVPFIEFALQMLAEEGRHGFIVSAAYQTEEYGRRSRELLLTKTTIESLTFAPDVSFFEEAQVHNLIYAVRRGAPPKGHRAKRYKAVAPALGKRDIKTLPALSQSKWGERIFRSEFEGEDGLDFSECLELGEICYTSYGMRLNAKDGSFAAGDVIANHKHTPFIKPYVEGKDTYRHFIQRQRWLEWGTHRVPNQVYRPVFPELFETKKLIVPRRAKGGMLKVFYDKKGVFFCDATTICVVPYHALVGIDQRVLRRQSIKRLVAKGAALSKKFLLEYMAALIGCQWLSGYLFQTLRTGKIDFYPNDLKRYPIPPADAETQAEIARLVEEIMRAKADVQRWREQGHRIDESGVVLDPRPFLDAWNVPHGDLVDAAGFLTHEIGGRPTTLELQGQRLTFRKQPLSYFESEHEHVLAYLQLYLETNADALDAVPANDLFKHIRIPRSSQAVRDFLAKLKAERKQVTLRWMTAAQHEALIEEIAFDLYNVDDDRREKLGGRLYTFADLPAGTAFVSILDNERDNPMRRVAFRKDGDWRYRAPDPLPHAALLWIHDGQNVTTVHRIP